MSALGIALFAALGFAVGLVHLASLRRMVDLYARDGARARAVLLHVLRLVFVASALVLLARVAGATGLLAGFAGFLAARIVVLRRFERSS